MKRIFGTWYIRGLVLLVVGGLLGIAGVRYVDTISSLEVEDPLPKSDMWDWYNRGLEEVESTRSIGEGVDWSNLPWVWARRGEVKHLSGRVVETLEGPWQPVVEGTFSCNIVLGTYGARHGTADQAEVSRQYKGKVFDIGPNGVDWCYELEEWACITDVKRLPNGNYIFLHSLNGIYEITPEGEEIAFVVAPTASHCVDKLRNGNYLYAAAPENRVYEVEPGGRVIWYWDANEHMKNLPTRGDLAGWYEGIYSRQAFMRGMSAEDWTHINYVQRLRNGNTIISLRNLDLVIEVNPEREVVRTFGALRILGQHTPEYQEETDCLLIFDNGHDRVAEFNWGTQELVWEFTGLDSILQGSCQRLDSGNVLIGESCQGRVLEVNPGGEVVATLEMLEMQIYRAFGY